MLDTTNHTLDSFTIHHAAYARAMEEMRNLLKIASQTEGAIIPLLGPTRCGKTALLEELKTQTECIRPGPGILLETSDFAFGTIPPKPNDRDLYITMLTAIGLHSGQKERTSLLRDRLIQTIKDHGIQIIALDEASHCAERGANLSERGAADHFKTIVDRTGITLILSGLPKFQNLVDGNEQFRDRALKSVLLNPYSWSLKDDRYAFNQAFEGILNQIELTGLKLDFDSTEIVRRIYGASGGRVGIMIRILKAALSCLDDHILTASKIAHGAISTVQSELMPEHFFQADEPSDFALVRSYVKVMQDAELNIDPTTIAEFASLEELK